MGTVCDIKSAPTASQHDPLGGGYLCPPGRCGSGAGQIESRENVRDLCQIISLLGIYQRGKLESLLKALCKDRWGGLTATAERERRKTTGGR